MNALDEMLPWFFAYDRTNYARYLPFYMEEMKALPQSQPFVHEHLRNGHFGIQRQEQYGFSRTACDQLIEQTVNRDSKTKGGPTGITLNKSAVKRWILSSPLRSKIYRACMIFCGQQEDRAQKRDMEPSSVKRDEQAVEAVQDTVVNMINPFTSSEKVLLSISSGIQADPVVAQDIQAAYCKGQKAATCFNDERVKENKASVFQPLKRLNLKTFSDNGKLCSTKGSLESRAIKNSQVLLSKMVMLAQKKKCDIDDVLSYPLAPIPAAIGTVHGSLVKTNKAAIVHCVEKEVKEFVEDTPSGSVAVLLDGMSCLQQFTPRPQSTFGELADDLMKMVVSRARAMKASRLDLVFDTYPEQSIKNSERDRRAASGTQVFQHIRADQQMPKQYNLFVSLLNV